MFFIADSAKILRLSDSDIPESFQAGYVKKISAGHVTEFVEMKTRPKPIDAVRVSKDAYVKPSEENGELHFYNHASDKSGCTVSVRRSLSSLRLIINANCSDASRLSWVTLTYAENMTDTKRLYADYKAFWKRFLYWCKKQGYSKPEYIAVAEPQGRGAWHLHCLWIWSEKAPFIENNAVLWKLWGHGFTKIKAVRTDCDNIGAYFSAYLADMDSHEYQKAFGQAPVGEWCEEKQCLEDDGTEVKKSIVKGARLRLYPAGMQIYRASRGVLRPAAAELDPDCMAKEKASAGTLTFSAAVAVLPDDGAAVRGVVSGNKQNELRGAQIISKSYYNRKKWLCQAAAHLIEASSVDFLEVSDRKPLF